MSESSHNPKLKILCLHGFNQDGNTFKNKLGGFRKSIKDIADLVFVDAPHVVPTEGLRGDGVSENARSWWFTTNQDTFIPFEKTDIAKGFYTSVEQIKMAFQAQGPFDGILGFSQGAAFTALVCGLKENAEFPYPFQFVILVAGFRSSSTCHCYLYDTHYKIKSLHIIGENDQIMKKEKSEELIPLFVDPEVIYHDGGHFLPTAKEVQSAYKRFLRDCIVSDEGRG